MNKIIKISEEDLYYSIKKIMEGKDNHVVCERCDWDWDITSEDEDPYLCHMCGHRNDPQENKEGVGAYDAPAFEMEPDHTTFKHEYSEQDEPTRDQYIRFVTPLEDEPFDFWDKIPDGPLKILNKKFSGKEYTTEDDDFEITYGIEAIGPGRKFIGGWLSDFTLKPGQNSISGYGKLKKVIYKGQDVTDIVRRITNKGGTASEIASYDFSRRINTVAKALGLYPERFKISIY